MDKDLALLVAGIIFGIVSLLHLSRVVFQFDMSVCSKRFPVWLNFVGFLITGGMCVWMFMAR